ncbi:MAG: hypothetical protein WC483_00290 [Candidatus Paceibacterota bacterium]
MTTTTKRIRGAIVESEAEPELRDVVVKIVLDAYEELGLADMPMLQGRIDREIEEKYGGGWSCAIVRGQAILPAYCVPRTLINIQTRSCRFTVYRASAILGEGMSAYEKSHISVEGRASTTPEETDAALQFVSLAEGRYGDACASIALSMRDMFKCEWIVLAIAGDHAIAPSYPQRYLVIRVGTIQFIFMAAP